MPVVILPKFSVHSLFYQLKEFNSVSSRLLSTTQVILFCRCIEKQDTDQQLQCYRRKYDDCLTEIGKYAIKLALFTAAALIVLIFLPLQTSQSVCWEITMKNRNSRKIGFLVQSVRRSYMAIVLCSSWKWGFVFSKKSLQSVFTHVASTHANLLKQKEVFT